MKFKMIHENYNVQDLNRSLEFYGKALGLKERNKFYAAHALNSEIGCIYFENNDIGIYFIQNSDGYRLEILP